MKNLITLIFLLFLSACIFSPYTVVKIPTNYSGDYKLNLPKGSPDITTFAMKWIEQFSNITCAMYFKNSAKQLYTLVVLCNEVRILGLVNCNCDDDTKEAEYYIYREKGGKPEQVLYKEFKMFMAEYDPAWKERVAKKEGVTI